MRSALWREATERYGRGPGQLASAEPDQSTQSAAPRVRTGGRSQIYSVVTIGELHAAVPAAPDTATRARRLSTLEAVSAVEPLPITTEAARRWAELRVRLPEQGRRAKGNDLWIAAVAKATPSTKRPTS